MKRFPAVQIPALAATLLLIVSCTNGWHSRHSRAEMVPDTFLVTNPYIDRFMREVDYTGDDEYTISHILEYPGGGPGEADIPPAVHLSWEHEGASTVRVNELPVTEDSWGWNYEVTKDSSNIDIYNLVPQRDYEYYVITEEGDTLQHGLFYTVGTLHHAFMRPLVRNARDLGGWKTRDGRTVAYRKLYRGGRIVGEDGTSVYINKTGKADARALGIGAELDLREEGKMPEFSPLGPGVTFCAPGFPLGGSTMLGEYKPGVAQSFHFIVRSLHEGRGVFFHCSAGRDRTGTMTALLLGVLGVSEGDIGEEYELTYFAPKGYSMYSKSPDEYYHTRINGIRNSCRYIRKNYGGETFQQSCENYLQAIGVSRREIEDFRNLVLQ